VLIRRTEPTVFLSNNVMQVHYKRIALMADDVVPAQGAPCKAPICTRLTATLDFQLLDKMPSGRADGNPLKFFVTRSEIAEGAGS
jgi:hypothetical protein